MNVTMVEMKEEEKGEERGSPSCIGRLVTAWGGVTREERKRRYSKAFRQRKMSVQEYLDKHMLSRKIEDAVNAAVRAKTPDPVLFISNHMKKSVPSVITNVKARQILDSRGIPTVEVDLYTNKGLFRASAPSGSSSGMYEATELRDGDKGTYLGNGVSRAVKNVNEKISEALIGMDPTLQIQIDQAMIDLDKTEKKVPLYKHIADLAGKTNYSIPVPAFTLISGGKHAGNNLAIQDIVILPVGTRKFEEALQVGSETYHHLKAVITEKYGPHGCNVGEDGGFAPNISRQVSFLKEGLDFVKEAIARTGYNEKIKIAIGVAATEFCIAYPIVSIEDPFDKEDWEHSKYFSSLGICQVVGDDLLMSNPKRIERAVQDAACNALLLKVPSDRFYQTLAFLLNDDTYFIFYNNGLLTAPFCSSYKIQINQVGTVTEAIEAVKLAKDANWGVVISQRTGESEDSFLADLAVGLGSGQIKAGAPCRGERLAKYNQVNI
ncbi:hypothetical protein DH2020_012174 [Rehmannia glutinosa]|uniref:phosphopyruvate hydratase n=1 Tax=Rehmannia glutinosa TaxID=99300 RepID=A0ABR0W414_REHGL